MLLKCRWEMVMWVIMGLSGEMLILRMWVEVEDDIEDKAPHNCWDMFLEDLSLQGSSNWGSNQSSHHSTMMGWSREGNWGGRAGRGLKGKVNLLIFKDEKTKDTVTYYLWRWDVATFFFLGWDDQHLLPYIFPSLQGFPGDLVRSLGEDTTLTDILKMLDEHHGVVITFDILSKEHYSLKQGYGENIAEFRLHLSQQFQILQSTWEWFNRSM